MFVFRGRTGDDASKSGNDVVVGHVVGPPMSLGFCGPTWYQVGPTRVALPGTLGRSSRRGICNAMYGTLVSNK